jgi:hypothetical protein
MQPTAASLPRLILDRRAYRRRRKYSVHGEDTAGTFGRTREAHFVKI